MASALRLAFLSALLALPAAACRDSGGGSGDADAGVDPDGGGGDEENVMVCDVDLPGNAEGPCTVTDGAGTAILLQGDVLGDGIIYENGSVVVDGDKITCVGCDCGTAAGVDNATVIACPGSAISPGLINPHDHITFTEGSPIDVGTKRYDHRHEWRAELSTPQNPHGTGGDSDGNRWGELRMLFSGVTSMVGSGKANNMVRNLDRLDGADREAGFEEVEFQTFSLGDSNSSSTNRPNCDWNYRDTEIEVSQFPMYLPHVAEGINDYAQTEFKCQSSSFGNAEDFTESNVTHIHSIGLHTRDYFNMARDDAKLLWSPRSNISLYGMTAAVQTFDRLGGTIALGTDWTYSGSANMIREMACADEYNRNQLNGYFSNKDIFEMATINAAIATSSEDLIGSLENGKLADIAIYSNSSRFYRSIIDAENKDVSLVLKEGRPLFGDTEIISALGGACDPVNVCGDDKSVCTSAEFGTSFSNIQNAVSSGNPAYPAFFCGAPSDEPTCVPSRPSEFTGVPSDNDADGDGLGAANDNCPDVFNPPRPIDRGNQADADGDGIGDACDDTPLPNDLDMDGHDNAVDNCPFDANEDQNDTDEDDKGDTCDFCPTVFNAEGVCPEVVAEATIQDVQNGTVAEGAKVLIKDAVVTAVWENGFWMQDPAGGAFSGVQVFSGPDHGLTVGTLVDVQGNTVEFFGDTEIENTTITNKGATTPVEPTEVSVAQAASEDFEGVLVKLVDITSFEDPYNCAQDNMNCMDTGLWEVNGSVIVWDRAYEDMDYADHTSAPVVTGVMAFRFDRRRILPRTAADLPAVP